MKVSSLTGRYPMDLDAPNRNGYVELRIEVPGEWTQAQLWALAERLAAAVEKAGEWAQTQIWMEI